MEVIDKQELYQAPEVEYLEFHRSKDLLISFSVEGNIQNPLDGGNW